MIQLITAFILIISCSNNKAATDEKPVANNSSLEKAEGQGSIPNTSGNDIVGRWKLILDAFDENKNQILEDEERKKGVRNNYSLQLNADGTCRIMNMFNGTYTVKEEKEKKILSVQRKRVESEETEDPQPDLFYIKSVGKDELILLVVDGGGTTTFWIFKREK